MFNRVVVRSETETWQCLLCVNFAEVPEDEACAGSLSARQQRLVERITLELYCQYEPSLPFREPVPSDNLHYHAKVTHAHAHTTYPFHHQKLPFNIMFFS